MLIAGALALAFAVWRVWRERPRWPVRLALALAIAVWVAVLLVYKYAGAFFDRNAHGATATAMFLCIIGVACVNVFELKKLHGRRTYWNRYTPVAAAMILVLAWQLVTALVHRIAGGTLWAHQTIVVESLLLFLFAVFWVMQTWELWDEGLRSG